MSYRNKTYVAFASEDIHNYRLMTAWAKNENIDFNFFNAHDLYIARDTSTVETIRRRLRERLKNAKQVVLLGSASGKRRVMTGDHSFVMNLGQSLSTTFLSLSPTLTGTEESMRTSSPSSAWTLTTTQSRRLSSPR